MKSIAITLLSALLFAGAAAVFAEEDEHHHDTATSNVFPRLNDGERWASDAPLRKAMNNMRSIVTPRLGALHSGAMSDADFKEVANGIEAEVHYMLQNCRLPPDADAELHKIVATLVQGVQEMKTGAIPEAGMGNVIAGLTLYGQYFDHPGWRPLGE